MTARLNQVIAVEKGAKARVYSEIDKLQKLLAKPALFNGFTKHYEPLTDDGKKLAEEKLKVQQSVDYVLREIEKMTTEYFAIAARKDWTNCVAKADIVADGRVLVKEVPVTYLLFLEKQLIDLRTLASILPVLDDAEDWVRDENAGLFRSREVLSHRNEKIKKPIVLSPATREHPAQTKMVTVDELAGYWHLIKQSGAIPKPKQQRIIERIDALIVAVKEAREAANGVAIVEAPNVGRELFDFIFERFIE